MPQLIAVSLNDRETTPVAHAFTPFDISSGVGYLVRSTGVPVGDEILTISSRKSGARRKNKLVLTVPVVQTQTINGISTPLVVRKAYAEVNFNFDETSTEQERKNLVGMTANALAASQVMLDAVLVKLEGVY